MSDNPSTDAWKQIWMEVSRAPSFESLSGDGTVTDEAICYIIEEFSGEYPHVVDGDEVDDQHVNLQSAYELSYWFARMGRQAEWVAARVGQMMYDHVLEADQPPREHLMKCIARGYNEGESDRGVVLS